METLFANVARATLDNGLTVLIKENHSNPIVAIYTYVKAGYLYEPDEMVGISHLIEHMFFKGTRKRKAGDIALQTKALGGYLNASTIYDHTLYYTVLPSRHFFEGLEIQADALIDSQFDPGELERETEVVIQEAKRKLDNPAAVVREKLFGLAFEKHRIRRWRIGTEAGLRALTREHFVDFHQDFYRPENVILTIVGDISASQVLSGVEACYGKFARGVLRKQESESEPSQRQLKYRRLRGDIGQCHLAMGFHTPGIFDPDTYALEMLALILGYGRSSRLYATVRQQKGLASAISASNYTIQELGYLMINALTNPARLRDAEQEIIAVIGEIHKAGITENELQRARTLLETFLAFGCESVSGQASLLSSYEACGDFNLLKDYLAKLQAVTVGDVRKVVAEYITPENFSVFEFVPEGEAMESIDEETLSRACRNAWGGTQSGSPASNGTPAEQQLVGIAARPPRGSSGPARRQLANGLILLVKEDHRAPLVSLGFFAKGGRIDESEDQSGLTRFMTRCSLQGTENLGAEEIASRIEDLGSSINCVYEPDYCGFTTQLLSRNFAPGLSLLLDIINNAVFPETEIRKERENTLAFLAQFRDDMFRYPIHLFHTALFPKHPYGYPALGGRAALQKIEQSGLVSWQKKLFSPDNMVAVCVGDIDPDSLARDLESVFQNSSPGVRPDPVEIAAPEKEGYEIREKEQTALVLGFRGPVYGAREKLALILLQNIVSGLGGRFFEELRGRQSLAYTVSSFLVARRHAGAFMTYIATSPENEITAIDSLLREFEKLQHEAVTAEELSRAKTYTIGTREIGLETLGAQMSQYAHVELLGGGLEDIETFPDRLQSVTADEIMEASRTFFNLDNYTLGIVRARTDQL